MRGALNRNLLRCLMREIRRQIEYTVPFIHVVLMDFRGNDHLRDAIPMVQHLTVVPETGLPLVGAGAQRERWERVREDVDAGIERELLGSTGPHQLALRIEERESVLGVGNALGQLDD